MNKLWVAGLLSATVSGTSFAATEITWWHAMGGELGDLVEQLNIQCLLTLMNLLSLQQHHLNF